MAGDFLKHKYFDLKFLRDIADDDDEAIIDIINSFLSNNPNNLRELENAIHNGDSARVPFATHKLVGAYNLVGAAPLAELAKHIEAASDDTVVKGSLHELKERALLLDNELKSLVVQMSQRM